MSTSISITVQIPILEAFKYLSRDYYKHLQKIYWELETDLQKERNNGLRQKDKDFVLNIMPKQKYTLILCYKRAITYISYRVTGLYRLGKTCYLHSLLCNNSIIAQFSVQ